MSSAPRRWLLLLGTAGKRGGAGCGAHFPEPRFWIVSGLPTI